MSQPAGRPPPPRATSPPGCCWGWCWSGCVFDRVADGTRQPLRRGRSADRRRRGGRGAAGRAAALRPVRCGRGRARRGAGPPGRPGPLAGGVGVAADARLFPGCSPGYRHRLAHASRLAGCSLPGLFAQAGIAEELLFRGYLFGHLREGRSFWRAALLSMPPFLAVHLLLFFQMDFAGGRRGACWSRWSSPFPWPGSTTSGEDHLGARPSSTGSSRAPSSWCWRPSAGSCSSTSSGWGSQSADPLAGLRLRPPSGPGSAAIGSAAGARLSGTLEVEPPLSRGSWREDRHERVDEEGEVVVEPPEPRLDQAGGLRERQVPAPRTRVRTIEGAVPDRKFPVASRWLSSSTGACAGPTAPRAGSSPTRRCRWPGPPARPAGPGAISERRWASGDRRADGVELGMWCPGPDSSCA